MSAEFHQQSHDDKEFLFGKAANGLLSQQEFQQLEEELLADAALRTRYLDYMALEADLYENYSAPFQMSSPDSSPVRPHSRKLIGLTVLAALCLIFAAAVLVLPRAEPAPKDAAVDAPDRNQDPVTFQLAGGDSSQGVQFSIPVITNQRPVAVITNLTLPTSSAANSRLRRGTRLPPGILTVNEGTVRLEFMKGAVVFLEAPATLQLDAVDSATLLQGRAAARIPSSAKGFFLNSPSAACSDLGTEFSLSVDEFGSSEYHVVEGEIEVSVLGEDGNTLLSERVRDPSTIRVGRDSGTLETLDQASQPMLVFHVPERSPLSVPQEYVDAVRASRPLFYWRFEDLEEDGTVPNELGEEWAGRVHNEDPQTPAAVVQDGMISFLASQRPRYLTIAGDGYVTNLNQGSFSLEMWVNPDHLHWSSLVAVYPEWDLDEIATLSHIELAHETPLVHPPATIRYLHRYPPGKSKRTGTNLFSSTGFTPSLWHHIVAVKTTDELKLYLNGELVRQRPEKHVRDETAYRFVFGQQKMRSSPRQFRGSMDEVAVYLHELTPAEVQSHFRLMRLDQN